jgi:hypothetical protein
MAWEGFAFKPGIIVILGLMSHDPRLNSTPAHAHVRPHQDVVINAFGPGLHALVGKNIMVRTYECSLDVQPRCSLTH